MPDHWPGDADSTTPASGVPETTGGSIANGGSETLARSGTSGVIDATPVASASCWIWSPDNSAETAPIDAKEPRTRSLSDGEASIELCTCDVRLVSEVDGSPWTMTRNTCAGLANESSLSFGGTNAPCLPWPDEPLSATAPGARNNSIASRASAAAANRCP